MMRFCNATLATMVLLALLTFLSGTRPASAQGGIPAPTNLNAYDGAAAGEVVITWNAVPSARLYRVGWVAFDDYQEAQAAGRNWLEAFAFVDVANRGQTSHTVKRLTPGTLYAFIVATNNSRYGEPNYPQQWARLTLSGTAPVCPIGEPTPPQPQPAPTGSVAGDREALTALYNSTNGPNWINNSGWLTNQNFGHWHGVNSRTDGRATGLFMRNNRISGQLPTQLGNLTEFDYLDLAENQIAGGIPAELGRLSKLESIYLFDNQISGSIPSSLGNLSQLGVLHLYKNRLSGQIPASLGNLANLRVLHLRDNNLSGPIPASLGSLDNLEWMQIAGNDGLTGCIPAGLRDVPNNDFARTGLPFC